MSDCTKTCTTVGDIAVRVARQVGDYSDGDSTMQFVTWTKSTITDYYNEAALMLLANRPDAYAKTVEMTLAQGSVQQIPSGYRSFGKIEINVADDGSEAETAIPGDDYFTRIMATKMCTKGCDPTADYSVKSFSKSKLTETEFTVSPPVPPGISPRVKAVLIKDPAKVCSTDWDKCVEFNAVYAPAIVEWMLYRAWGSDAEIVGGANAAALHYKAFFNTLGIQLQREREFFSGINREAKQ